MVWSPGDVKIDLVTSSVGCSWCTHPTPSIESLFFNSNAH
jgi:hypothetical protein